MKRCLKIKVYLLVLFFMNSMNMLAFADSVGNEVNERKVKKENAVYLKIAVVLEQNPTKLLLSITNNSEVVFTTTPLFTNYNRLLIITPAGQRIEHFRWKDVVKPIDVKPKESQSWDVDISPILSFRGFNSSGLYEIYWQCGDINSNHILFYKKEGVSKSQAKCLEAHD